MHHFRKWASSLAVIPQSQHNPCCGKRQLSIPCARTHTRTNELSIYNPQSKPKLRPEAWEGRPRNDAIAFAISQVQSKMISVLARQLERLRADDPDRPCEVSRASCVAWSLSSKDCIPAFAAQWQTVPNTQNSSACGSLNLAAKPWATRTSRQKATPGSPAVAGRRT